MTSDTGSVTRWLQRLQAGESGAAQAIWDRFYQRVVRFAELQMKRNADRAVDGEDIAQSAFRAVYHAVMNGRYPDMDNRQELWQLLIVSIRNRVRRHFRDIHTQKRMVNEKGLLLMQDRLNAIELSGPVAQAELADLLAMLLRVLDQEDPTGELRQIALLQLEEYSASAIARKLKRRKSYILQRVRMIRILWQESALL